MQRVQQRHDQRAMLVEKRVRSIETGKVWRGEEKVGNGS